MQPELLFRDERGQNRLKLGITSDSVPFVSFYDLKGVEHLDLSVWEFENCTEPNIVMRDAQSRRRLSLEFTDSDGPELNLSDDDEKSRMMLGLAQAGRPIMVMQDIEELDRVVCEIDQGGKPKLEIIDTDGTVARPTPAMQLTAGAEPTPADDTHDDLQPTTESAEDRAAAARILSELGEIAGQLDLTDLIDLRDAARGMARAGGQVSEPAPAADADDTPDKPDTSAAVVEVGRGPLAAIPVPMQVAREFLDHVDRDAMRLDWGAGAALVAHMALDPASRDVSHDTYRSWLADSPPVEHGSDVVDWAGSMRLVMDRLAVDTPRFNDKPDHRRISPSFQ
ncbi:MAG: hypothetical protein GY778_09945 [bacterium]|nr:hypothetical protein [bacterium]